MGLFDMVIASFIVMGLWRGYQAGLIRSLLGLLGWFIALVAATRLAPDVAPQLAGVVNSPVLQVGLSFLLVVLIVLVAVKVVAGMATGLLSKLHVGWLNQIGGGVLGAGKNILVVLALLSVLAPFLGRFPFWQSSVLAPELMPYAPFAKHLADRGASAAWHRLDAPVEAGKGIFSP